MFLYDRLGIGQSSKISGFAAQIPTQVEILRQLVGVVRSGEYAQSGSPSVDKIVVMGHALGAVIVASLLEKYPTIGDATVLENLALGLSGGAGNQATDPRIASLQNPSKFGYADEGYLTWVDRNAAAGL